MRTTRGHLEAFLEIVEHRSILGAARATGRSRTTYLRYLDDLRADLGAPVLLRRAPGQRQGVLTPAGGELARRARVLLQHWDQWQVATRDALAQAVEIVRVGALPGSFDLIAEILSELRHQVPDLPLKVVEYPEERLLGAVEAGAVDLGFGTLDPQGVPSRLHFDSFGPLPWAVILPDAMSDRFPSALKLSDLDGVPLVVMRAGAARERLERQFDDYASGPLVLDAAFEVGSTPRMVEMVARGFGPAVVSRFRLAFLTSGVEVRPLIDGPAPLTAGVFTRREIVLSGAALELVDHARGRFRALAGGATGRT